MILVAGLVGLQWHYQCSELSSPSVLEVGPDRPLVVVCLFLSLWTTIGNGVGTGHPMVPCRALWIFPI